MSLEPHQSQRSSPDAIHLGQHVGLTVVLLICTQIQKLPLSSSEAVAKHW